jgi:hypothetical protein
LFVTNVKFTRCTAVPRSLSSAPSTTANAAQAPASREMRTWLSMFAAYTGEHQCQQTCMA